MTTTTLPVRPDTIPAELKARDQWVCWHEELLPGRDKPTKPPRDPRTGGYAYVNKPATWATYTEAIAAYERGEFQGIGYVISDDDPFSGADLDHCRNVETEEIEPWAQDIVRRLDSYTEVSPSGAGLRVWCRGALPPDGRRRGSIELYDDVRYLTVTGHHLDGTPATIEDRTAELADVHREIFTPPTGSWPRRWPSRRRCC
jgi:putative DNA primase/helicase